MNPQIKGYLSLYLSVEKGVVYDRNLVLVLATETNALSMYIVTFTLISNLATDCIQKKTGQAPGVYLLIG